MSKILTTCTAKTIYLIKQTIKSVISTICLLYSYQSYSQADNEFWFAPPGLTADHGHTPISFVFYTSTQSANVTITKPADPTFKAIEITIPADSFYIERLAADEYQASFIEVPVNEVSQRGFFIKSTSKIGCYYQVDGNNGEVYSLKGRSALGKNFLVPMQNVYTNGNYNPTPYSSIQIVATQDNTEIEIDPSYNNGIFSNGECRKTPFSIILNKGETYAVRACGQSGDQHIHNTFIRANKPIAVNSTDDSVVHGGAHDLVGDQILPIEYAGTEYIAVYNEESYESIYIFPVENNTSVWINGNSTPLMSGLNIGDTGKIRLGEYCNSDTKISIYVRSDKPIVVFQETGKKNEAGGTMLPQLACYGSKKALYKNIIRSIVTDLTLNVIVRKEFVNDFTICGKSFPSSFFHLVDGQDDWRCARVTGNTLLSMDLFCDPIVLENKEGFFYLGIIDNDGASCSQSFFSDYYPSVDLPIIGMDNNADTLTVCVGNSVDLEINFDGVFEWRKNDVLLSSTQTFSINSVSLYDSGFYILKKTDKILDCQAISERRFYIEVKPKFLAGTISNNQTICYNTSPLTLTGALPTGGSENYVYQWQISTDSLKWSNITGATEQNYASGNLVDTSYFRRQTTDSQCGTKYSDGIKIAVLPNLSGIVSGNQSICYNETPSELAVSIASTNKYYDYQWQISTNNRDWADISGATAENYNPEKLTDTRYFRRKTTSAECASSYSDSIKISIMPNLMAGTITSNQLICYNSPPSPLLGILPTGGSQSYDYQWQISSDGLNWTNIDEATQQNYNPEKLSDTRYFRRQTNDSQCGTAYSNIVEINTMPVFSAGKIFDNMAICHNSVAELTGTNPVGGSDSYVYQWQISYDNINWTNIEKATDKNHDTDTLSLTAYFRRQTTDSQCGTLYTDTVTVNVNDEIYLLPEKLPPYQKGSEYSQRFSSNATIPLYSWSGNLPDGLFFDSFGYLSGKVDAQDISTSVFTVSVKDANNCEVSRQYTMTGDIAVYKVFTPNGDGINDIFMPGYKIIVIDRLGQLIHKGDNGWDGKYKGKTVSADIYFFKLVYIKNNIEITQTGYVGVEN